MPKRYCGRTAELLRAETPRSPLDVGSGSTASRFVSCLLLQVLRSACLPRDRSVARGR